MKRKYNIAIEIFGRLWAAWGIVTFIITFLIIFIPSMCSWLFRSYVEGQAFFIKVSRFWMRIWLFLIGCSPKVYGWENFKNGENYIVTFNHNALLDVPLSAPFIPGPNMTIAKKSFAKAPIFGWFYQRGSILIDRDDPNSRRKSFEAMTRVLEAGMHMCIYPEGTRNRTPEAFKPFHDGAFKLASVTGKQIIPCVITGTARALPHHKVFFLLPTRLGMYFLPPVSPAGKSIKELNEEVRDKMKEIYHEKEKWTRL